MTDTTEPTPEEMLASDRDEFERLGTRVMSSVADYLAAVPAEAVDRKIPEDVCRRLMSVPLPRRGMDAGEVFDFIERDVLPWPQPTGHQRSFGWVNSPPMPISIMAEVYTQAMNSSLDGFDYSGLFLMVTVGRWLMELTGFPDGPDSMALLFSGGSAANLNALTVARYRAAKEDGWNVREQGIQGGGPPMTVYVSDQAHSSIQRCVEQLGIGTRYMRVVPTDSAYRMDAQELAETIQEDRQSGLRPMAVVASAGTTNVAAIDDLESIAEVCERHGLWFHVDGAYGGFAGLDPGYADALAGVARADSLTVDPHKWLHVSLDCGALLTRHRSLHREAFTLTPDYLSKGDEHQVPWPYEYMFQLTYSNRAIKTFAAIARLGKHGFASLVSRNIRMAQLLDELVQAAPDLELLAPTSLSVVNFRYVPPGSDLDEGALDSLNRHISGAIGDSGLAHMPTTRVDGRTSLRVCVLHAETSEEDVRQLLDLVRRFAGEWPG